MSFFKRVFTKFLKWREKQKAKYLKMRELERSGKLWNYRKLTSEEKKLANELYWYWDE